MLIAVGSSLYFALAMAATTVMFLAWSGPSPSQLSATRRQAAALGAALLGVKGMASALIADAGVGFHGLIRASPLGWVEELQPLTSPKASGFPAYRRLHCLACHLRDDPRR